VLTWRNAAMAVLLAALSNSVYYALVVVAVRDAGVAPTSLAIGTIPLWLAMLGRFEAHVPQPPRMRLVAPLVLIAAGIGLINADAFARPETGEHFARGASARVPVGGTESEIWEPRLRVSLLSIVACTGLARRDGAERSPIVTPNAGTSKRLARALPDAPHHTRPLRRSLPRAPGRRRGPPR
ncbi:MAG: hypothetical protein ACK4N5_02215, partial [Myxococcales bacterium]